MPYLVAALSLILALAVAGVIWAWVRLLLSPVSEALTRADKRRSREHGRLVALLDPKPDQPATKPRHHHSGI